MDNQAVSYQTTYSLRGNFTFDYLGQSQTHFTEISSEPPPAVLKLPTPVERKGKGKGSSLLLRAPIKTGK